jgi:CheY-like chemotaxis protein
MPGQLMNVGTCPPGETIKVLLVEDNRGDARLVEEILSEVDGNPFRLEWADTLLKSLQCLSRSEFDVALVDLSLPDSDGLVTFKTIQEHAPGLPIVLLTGFENDGLAVEAVEKGAEDYLVKGKQTSATLARALRYAVARRSKQPERSGAQRLATSIGIMGAKGGVGTTTLACHIALEMGAQSGASVLLADFETDSAGCAFLLNAQHTQSIAEAMSNLHRLDTDLWRGLVWKHSGELWQQSDNVPLTASRCGDAGWTDTTDDSGRS